MFEIFGRKVFDFSQSFSYIEIFLTAFVVVGISFLLFLYLSNKAKKECKKGIK